MRRIFWGVLLAVSVNVAGAQTPTVAPFTTALRFSPAAWELFKAADDSLPAAWCSNGYHFDLKTDTIYVQEMHATSQVFDPPCGTDAIILKRPACLVTYLEAVSWWLQPPRALIAACKTPDGVPHFIAIQWPTVTRGTKVED